jgi:catechol 2,3-dioxygenase-like lactoylglutathione lyase family enzyme
MATGGWTEQYALVIETEGLTHLQLTVRDLARSMAFYRSVFGMEEMYRDGPSMVFLRTPGARDTITLNADPSASGPSQGGVAHFGFRLKDRDRLEEAITAVVEAGGRLVERGARPSGHAFAYVTDPDGYVIEL